MSVDWITGIIALVVMGATVYFIAARIEMPDWWNGVVVGTIISRLFGSKNGKNDGGGNGT